MDSTTAAEEFPGLYRAILDGVAQLERAGLRDEANRIRRAATMAYSGPWGDAGHRRLELLLARIERTLASPDRSQPGRLRPRARVADLRGLVSRPGRVPSAR